MKTLFLQAPSYDGFDGGAGSRYQAVDPHNSLVASAAIDFVCREEFERAHQA